MEDPGQASILAHEQASAPLLNEARERSLNEDLQRLAGDSKAYAQAELNYQKSRVTYAAGAAKSIALYVIVAAVLVFFALMALVVGLVIALAPLITAWGSTALVTLVLLAVAVVLLLSAKKRAGLMMAAVSSGSAI